MPVTASDIKLGPVNSSAVYVSGALHNVFGAGVVGGATDYALIEVRNMALSGSWVTPKLWLSLDPSGAAVAVSVADGTARADDYAYSVDPSTLTFSAPVTQATGLSLPTLGPSQKCLFAVRRILSGASTAFPESNAFRLFGETS